MLQSGNKFVSLGYFLVTAIQEYKPKYVICVHHNIKALILTLETLLDVVPDDAVSFFFNADECCIHGIMLIIYFVKLYV